MIRASEYTRNAASTSPKNTCSVCAKPEPSNATRAPTGPLVGVICSITGVVATAFPENSITKTSAKIAEGMTLARGTVIIALRKGFGGWPGGPQGNSMAGWYLGQDARINS